MWRNMFTGLMQKVKWSLFAIQCCSVWLWCVTIGLCCFPRLWNGVVPERCRQLYKRGEEWQCFFGHKLYSTLTCECWLVPKLIMMCTLHIRRRLFYNFYFFLLNLLKRIAHWIVQYEKHKLSWKWKSKWTPVLSSADHFHDFTSAEAVYGIWSKSYEEKKPWHNNLPNHDHSIITVKHIFFVCNLHKKETMHTNKNVCQSTVTILPCPKFQHKTIPCCGHLSKS